MLVLMRKKPSVMRKKPSDCKTDLQWIANPHAHERDDHLFSYPLIPKYPEKKKTLDSNVNTKRKDTLPISHELDSRIRKKRKKKKEKIRSFNTKQYRASEIL